MSVPTSDEVLLDFEFVMSGGANGKEIISNKGYSLLTEPAYQNQASPNLYQIHGSSAGDGGEGWSVAEHFADKPVDLVKGGTLDVDASGHGEPGGTFGVISVDLDALDNDPNGDIVQETITAHFGDGSSDEQVQVLLDQREGFETFVLPAFFGSNLVSLTFGRTDYNSLVIDNIRIAPQTTVQLDGTTGDDLIDGVQASAAIDGKRGNDTVTFDNANDGVTASLATGQATGLDINVAMVNVENLTGSAYDDLLTGSGRANVLTGGDGDDQLYGGAGHDTLSGGLGADLLDGGAGADAMTGGAGDDIYVVDAAGDQVIELAGEGYDTVNLMASWTAGATSEIEKIVITGAGAINATGNAFTQEIDGNGAANRLADGGGAVLMIGGDGNDIYTVTNAATTIQEMGGAGTGVDEVRTTLNTYTLPLNVEKLTFVGTGDFHGYGTAADETIVGGDGNDLLDGMGGVDRLTGGLGSDTFVFDAPSTGVVTITDFTAGLDKLNLAFVTGADFLIGPPQTSGVSGHATVVYDDAAGNLYYEADGKAAHRVLLAKLGAHLDLHASDFLFG